MKAALIAATFATSAFAQPLPPAPAEQVKFTPPPESAIPITPLGDIIQFGRDVFLDTQRYAKPYVGNKLNCVNCHLDAGRRKGSAPLWAAYVAYPEFRTKNEQVNTLAKRLEGCFRYSMNGRMPPEDSLVVTGLIAYAYFLATGAPVGAYLEGRGFPEIAEPAQTPSAACGQHVYAKHCASCHQVNGEGLREGQKYLFPPLWGRDSYNKGAGMHRRSTAAAFIKANMPLGQGDTLTDQEAWDVAAYIDGKPRPADPRKR